MDMDFEFTDFDIALEKYAFMDKQEIILHILVMQKLKGLEIFRAKDLKKSDRGSLIELAYDLDTETNEEIKDRYLRFRYRN